MEVVDSSQNRDALLHSLKDLSCGGFNFDLTNRNRKLMSGVGKRGGIATANANATAGGSRNSSYFPSAWKTGTTICGIVFKNGVVLGADTRATGGSEVVDKNCEKIHYIAPNIYCCGAGTAADTEKTTDLIASQLELLRMSSGSPSRVVAALTLTKRLLYKYQGHVSAALVLGGVDVHGAHLYSIHPHGSTQKLPYTTMGSGSLAAMAVFESRYKEDMEEDDAIALVRDAIRAGIFNDLGSGSNVDITIIRNDMSTLTMRTYEEAAGRDTDYKSGFVRPMCLDVPKGATLIIEESFRPFKKPESVANASGNAGGNAGGAVESMDASS